MASLPKIKLPEKQRKIVKTILGGAIILLVGSLGLELTNTDFDLGKILSGKSVSESKVMRDKEGNIVESESEGKYTDEYNCEDFDTQDEAQKFFKKAGGPSQDTNRLDGDSDGESCESLPSKK